MWVYYSVANLALKMFAFVVVWAEFDNCPKITIVSLFPTENVEQSQFTIISGLIGSFNNYVAKMR